MFSICLTGNNLNFKIIRKFITFSMPRRKFKEIVLNTSQKTVQRTKLILKIELAFLIQNFEFVKVKTENFYVLCENFMFNWYQKVNISV